MQVWGVSLHINIQHAFNHIWRISHNPCNRKSCKARWRLSVPRCWGFAWKRSTRVQRRKCGNLFWNHGPEWSDLLISYNIKGNIKRALVVVFFTHKALKRENCFTNPWYCQVLIFPPSGAEQHMDFTHCILKRSGFFQELFSFSWGEICYPHHLQALFWAKCSRKEQDSCCEQKSLIPAGSFKSILSEVTMKAVHVNPWGAP